MSPVFDLLRTTAKTEPAIAALRDKLLSDRMNGMSFFVEQLARIGLLRDSITPAQAAETVWTLSSAEVFDLLTKDRRWSKDHYVAWLADTLERLLLP